MQITSVYLRNIKSYAEQRFDLSPGLAAIAGENGAGKSTIVEAVGYALYGFAGGPLAGFIREGERSAEIRVGFVSPLDGREYESVRALRMSAKSGAVSATFKLIDPEHGGTIAEGRDEVDRFLRQSLGFGDSTVDLRSIFADVSGVPQGRLTADFIDTPQARKAKFDPLIGTHDFRAAFDALRQPLNLLENEKADHGATLAALEERLKDLPGVVQSIADNGAAADENAALLSRIRGELTEAKAATDELTTRKELIDRLRSEWRASVQALELHTDAFEAAGERLGRAELAAERASATSAQSAEYLSTERRLDAADKRLVEWVRLSAETHLAQVKQDAAQARHDKAQADLDQLDALQGRLPELEHSAGVQTDLETRLNAARERAAILETARQQARGIAAEIEERTADRDQYERQIADAREGEGLAGETDYLQRRTADIAASIAIADAALSGLSVIQSELGQLNIDVEHETHVELPALELDLRRFSQHVSDRHRVALERGIDRGERLIEIYGDRIQAADPVRRVMLETTLRETRQRLEVASAARGKMVGIPVWEGQIESLSDHITGQNAQAVQSRAAVEDARKARSEAAAILRCIEGLGSPAPRVALEVARDQLGNRGAVLEDRAEAYRQIAQIKARLTALAEQSAPLAEAAQEVEWLQSRSDGLRPVHERHLKASAIMGHLPMLIAEHAAFRATAGEAAQAVERSKGALDKAEGGFDPADLDGALETQSTLQVQVGALGNHGKQLAAELTGLERDRLTLRQAERDGNATRAKIERTDTLHRILRLIRESLRDAGPEVTKALVGGVSSTANEIFCEIMGGYDQALEWDAEYGIWVQTGDHRRAFRQLSGGEQITAALSVRLALLRDLLRIDTAFLDEPTQNLDVTRRENLAEQIQRITGFSQLFVISHDDTFERLLQSVIHVEKTNGVSRVSVQ